MKFTTAQHLILFAAGALSQSTSASIYSLATTIPWSPTAPGSVDQSTVYNGIYYLADRSNAGVHVVSLANNSQIALVGGFVTDIVSGSISSSTSGPDGLIVLPDKNELWVGDGDGTVKVISLSTYKIVANITTGSKKRADEFAYDSKNGIVIVTNPNETPPYISVIGASNRTVLGKVVFNNATGLEQPAWNSVNGMFYASVPSTGAYPGGAIAMLNMGNFSVSQWFKLPNCVPAGIVFGPSQHLFVSCSQDQILKFGYASGFVISGVDGSLIANISGFAGVDQVAYDSAANLFYASAYQMLANGSKTGAPAPIAAIVNASSNTLIQTIPTDNVTAHSIAADVATGNMLIPIKAQGIQVYSLKPSTSGGSSSTQSGASSSQTAAHTNSAAFHVASLAVILSAIFAALTLL